MTCAEVAGSVDERSEEGVMKWMLAVEPLRVPLDGNNERGRWQLGGFDDTVRSVGGDDESRGWAIESLVVIGIDHERGGAEDACQQRIRDKSDRVCWFVDRDSEFVLAMVEGVGNRIGDVLDERTPERDVEQLNAAANGENREIASDRVLDEPDFESIASGSNAVRFRVNGWCSVERWIDVATTGKE